MGQTLLAIVVAIVAILLFEAVPFVSGMLVMVALALALVDFGGDDDDDDGDFRYAV